ncbi:PPK2 family polyphosphate kinase [Micromonospora echinaurantiaca]|uniref:PPK2 family polyphosphate kinase n=1 Tax=Micromonospora echinaurantiaca TaxID=47857 RepID=UPI003722A5ED
MSAGVEAAVVAPVGGRLRELLRVSPGGPVELGSIDPRSTPGLPGPEVTGEHRKGWARGQVELVGAELGRQQEMLFATAKARAARADPTGLGGDLSGLGSAPARLGADPTGLGGDLSGLGSAPARLGAEPPGRDDDPAGLGGGPAGLDPAGLGSAGVVGERPAGGDGRRVLLVLQAMDCGGKDGAIKRVAGAMNPLGLHIRSFGAPTAEELRHHFLWRIRRALPPPGYVGIFNRSHYEDVLVARVESLVPEPVWQARYDEINAFERELAGTGVTLVKVLLHISYAEQGERLLDRLADPRKHWKYDPADVDARARWDAYQAAYAEALSRCGTPAAPWYVLPADRKWYRDWALAHLLRETFDTLQLGYPPAGFDVRHERERLLGPERSSQVNSR